MIRNAAIPQSSCLRIHQGLHLKLHSTFHICIISIAFQSKLLTFTTWAWLQRSRGGLSMIKSAVWGKQMHRHHIFDSGWIWFFHTLQSLKKCLLCIDLYIYIMYIIYIIFNHAFLLFQTTCFEHILLPQLLPDSTYPLHIHSFFLSVSVLFNLN